MKRGVGPAYQRRVNKRAGLRNVVIRDATVVAVKLVVTQNSSGGKAAWLYNAVDMTGRPCPAAWCRSGNQAPRSSRCGLRIRWLFVTTDRTLGMAYGL
jgi:hypothetical protein